MKWSNCWLSARFGAQNRKRGKSLCYVRFHSYQQTTPTMAETEPQDIEELQIDTLQFRSIGKISIGHKHPTSQYTTSRLLIVSNKYGFTLIGRPDSFLFIPTNQLVRFTLDNKQDTSAFQKVMVPPDGNNGLHTLSLSSDELTVGVVVGTKVMLFDVRGISKGVC